MHYFNDVLAIIYVASLTDYCCGLIEDELTNAMQESLYMFEKMINCQYLIESGVILFLNKSDLFQELCLKQGISLSLCFPDWKDNEYQDPRLPLVVPWMARDIDIIIPMDIVELMQLYIRSENEQSFAIYYENTIDFITQKFENRHHIQSKQIYTHVTNMIDDKCVSKLFEDITTIVINLSLMRYSI